MKKKGFATSAILYTILLLFLVLMVGILNNLQSKKTILDQLKIETIQAIESSNGTCYGLQEELDFLKGQGDATSEEILEGKTAIVQGELVTGSYKNDSTAYVFTSSPVDMKQYTNYWSKLTNNDFIAGVKNYGAWAHAGLSQLTEVSGSVSFNYNQDTGILTFSSVKKDGNPGIQGGNLFIVYLGTIDGN